jgi:hypothetical protein
MMLESIHLDDGGWCHSVSLGRPGRQVHIAIGSGSCYGGTGGHLGLSWRLAIYSIGWGFDDEHPLSGWPKFTDGPTPAGNRSRTLSWCGFLLQRFDAKGRTA